MKLLERLYLSLIRKPIKTFLLTALVFVVANVLSSSLMLYDSTQLILTDIKNQIKPSIVLNTEYDSYNYNDYLDGVMGNKDFRIHDIFKYKSMFDEMSKIEGIDYAGDSFITHFRSNDNLYTGGMNTQVDPYAYRLLSNELKNIIVITADSTNSVMFYTNTIEIVSGRNFTEEEIVNGSNVIILHESARLIDEYGKKKPIEIGSKITIHDEIYKSYIHASTYFSDFDEDYYYELNSDEKIDYLNQFLKNVDKYNEDYKNNLLYSKEYEFEVIGFYREKDYDEKSVFKEEDIGININPGSWSNFYTMIPENSFFNIVENRNHALNEIFDHQSDIKYNEHNVGILNNYFELNKSDDIDSIRSSINSLEKTNNLNVNIVFNNDIYLKIAGPLAAVNSVSSLMFIVGMITSMTILVFISVIFIKERKNEIGILLSIGENKKKVISQILLEMIIVCMLGIGLSMFTSKSLSQSIGNIILEDQPHKIELSDEEQLMVENEYSGIGLTNEFETLLESSNLLSVTSISLVVVLISTGISCLIILKMNPKEILM